MAALPKTLLQLEEAQQASPVSPVFDVQREHLSETPVVTTTDKVLDCVLPPRSYEVDGSVRQFRVVHEQISRQQLSDLRNVFDFKLQDSKARSQGLCPVRSSIHSMLFDEILRQVTIDCPERGLLLMRIRDELRMTTDAHAALYDASVAFSARKMHEAVQKVPEMRARIDELTADTTVLKTELRRLEAKHAAMVRCVEEQQQADQKKFQEEKLFMERTQQRLQVHLESVKEAQAAEHRRAFDDGEEGE